ncbi:MAG: ABC transporter ATP-binding protein [Oscillospiraceae bacterium]|nr:ABC transporter ATP-binding protein [Oscillospiraceae bacterium]MBQ9981680.1 ABC transporter ATP-binding protein [Oscillospiraceae bacterium]
MMKIEVKNAVKIIKNNKVINNISMTLESGKIYGFIGDNGSGKTMIIRAISGLIKLTDGDIIKDKNAVIGMILENIGLYQELSAYDNLRILAKIRNCISNKEIKEIISYVGLDPNDKRPLKKYSLGMRQRVVLAQAIMEEPDILLLDEPTNSLDSHGIEIVRKHINILKNKNKIVVIASHNHDDIFPICDIIYYFEKGKVSVVKE